MADQKREGSGSDPAQRPVPVEPPERDERDRREAQEPQIDERLIGSERFPRKGDDDDI